MHEDFAKFLFNVTKFIEFKKGEKLSSIVQPVRILYDQSSGLPMMMPGLVDKKKFSGYRPEDAGGSSIESVLRMRGINTVTFNGYFPPNQKLNTHCQSNIDIDKLKPFDFLNALDNHRVKDIDSFDFGKVPKIGEFVKGNGAASFFIRDTDAAASFMKSIGAFKKHYRFSCFLRHDRQGADPAKNLECADDELTLTVSFIDLPFAMPIYNFRKADGMGVVIGTIWPKTSMCKQDFRYYDKLYFAVAKDSTNVLYVDGQNINREGFVKAEYVKHFVSVLDCEKKRRKDIPKIVEKAKKAEEEREGMLKKMASAGKKVADERYDTGRIKMYKVKLSNATSTSVSTSDTSANGGGSHSHSYYVNTGNHLR